MAAKKTATEKVQPASTPAEMPQAAAPTRQPGMQIVAMQVDNIKRVSCVRIRPKGQVVTISGANGSGKSSILDAIDWAINGTRNIPSVPIKRGERTASIRVNFGDFEVLREFTKVEGGKEPYITKLRIFGRHKEQYPKPQELLDGFMGAISFDPLAFTRLPSAKQLETLRQLVKFDVDVDALEVEKKAAYDLRRDLGRDLDGVKARLRTMPAPPEGLPEKEIDSKQLLEDLRKANEHNTKVDMDLRIKQELTDAAGRDLLNIKTREEQIIELQTKIDRLNEEIKVFRQVIVASEIQAGKMQIQDRIDTAAISAQIEQAGVTNGAITRRNAYQSVEREVLEITEKWEAQDAIVQQKTKERAEAIARAAMPIEGLGIGDGEVLFQGLPFDQASNAEQIRASVALGMASNPTLRVMRIKDGSLLDERSLEMVSNMANSELYQIWIERVDTSAKVGVVMEDGEASGDDVEEPYREADKLKK